MSLCLTISKLASEIELQLNDLSNEHRKMIQVAKSMPKYLDEKNLANWERDYREAIHPNEDELSNNYQIIDLLYELASFNLFGKYQAQETLSLYRNVAAQLSDKGIKVTNNFNVDKW